MGKKKKKNKDSEWVKCKCVTVFSFDPFLVSEEFVTILKLNNIGVATPDQCIVRGCMAAYIGNNELAMRSLFQMILDKRIVCNLENVMIPKKDIERRQWEE